MINFSSNEISPECTFTFDTQSLDVSSSHFPTLICQLGLIANISGSKILRCAYF